MSVMADAGLKTRALLGLDVALLAKADALALIARRSRAGEQTLVVFANTNLLSASRIAGIGDAISRKCLVLNDGLGLNLVSRLIHSSPFPDNLNGTDLTPEILRAFGPATPVYCYGAKPDVLRKAADELERANLGRIVGRTDGYVSAPFSEAELVDTINASGAEIVLVGLGNPRQEEWTLAQADRLNARVIVCVGAFFDFTAGAFARAPNWAQTLRVEWLFRLLQEPQRLWRRYSVEPLSLAFLALRERGSRRGAARKP